MDPEISIDSSSSWSALCAYIGSIFGYHPVASLSVYAVIGPPASTPDVCYRPMRAD